MSEFVRTQQAAPSPAKAQPEHGSAETVAEAKDALIAAVNSLSDAAVYIASRDWFGAVMMGKPILAAARNERQEAAFDELLAAGFVHGDVERGVYGYRSTWRGRMAHPLCRVALSAASAQRQPQARERETESLVGTSNESSST